MASGGNINGENNRRKWHLNGSIKASENSRNGANWQRYAIAAWHQR